MWSQVPKDMDPSVRAIARPNNNGTSRLLARPPIREVALKEKKS